MAEAMAETKHQYEGMFILDANLGGKQWEKARDQLKEFLESRGAEILKMDKWEERKLAYEIGKHKRGLYVLVYFKAPTSRMAKIKKDCRITEWLVRELILLFEGKVTDDLFRKNKIRDRDDGLGDDLGRGLGLRAPLGEGTPREGAPVRSAAAPAGGARPA
jgi:ribosomal protein S6